MTLLGKIVPAVVGAASVELGITDLDASVAFYVDQWRLAVVERTARSVYLRGADRRHHILSLTQAPRSEVLSIALAANDRRAVDAVFERVRVTADSSAAAPSAIGESGGGYGFAFRDLDGRQIRVIAGDAIHGAVIDDAERPLKIGHIVVNSPKRAALAAQYRDVFGLRAIDETRIMTFLCAGGDHHFLALADHDMVSLNHIAFEVKNIDAVMCGVYRLAESGTPLEWGVGRHGPGNNVFAYFVGPGGEIVEYTCDVLQVDENYRIGSPADWVWPPGRIDHWGTRPPTARYMDAQGAVPFSATR